MNQYTVLITPASSLIVSVADIKEYLRVDSDAEDDLIETFIQAATQLAEKFTRRQFLAATYETVLDGFCNEIILDHSPVSAVTSIKYDSSSYSQDATLATSVYQVELGHEPARITLRDGQLWPETFKKKAAVRIRYTSGYTTVPKPLIQAVKLIVADWYEKREDSQRMLTQQSERILYPYRVFEF
jgi:uncharacterized phiE125 gp8 family phage protein